MGNSCIARDKIWKCRLMIMAVSKLKKIVKVKCKVCFIPRDQCLGVDCGIKQLVL